jgi:hypothetical protein
MNRLMMPRLRKRELRRAVGCLHNVELLGVGGFSLAGHLVCGGAAAGANLE